MSSFFWYDLETSGRSARRDRIVQFAGIRTDPDLEVIEAPLVSYCRLADDVLPEPGAALVTGITPAALRDAPNEVDLLRRVHTAFSVPNTCVVGFNSLRFDDEFIRHSFWRNFIDPYGREWQNGNSRWDLMDLVRAAGALRPDGVNWPLDEDGLPGYRLENLARANGIEHANAHDALSDVLATVELARRIRHAQPRLFDHYLKLRNREFVALQLGQPLSGVCLHVSGRLPRAQRGCALIAPLAPHPTNRNSMLVMDLCQDPAQLAGLSGAEIRARLYARGDDLPFERPRLKEVRANKVPFLAPVSVLRDAPAADHLVDVALANARLAWLRGQPEVIAAVVAAFAEDPGPAQPAAERDPDQALYDGFLSDADRALCERVAMTSPAQLAAWQPPFADPRLAPLLLRLRARNWPDSLNAQESDAWRAQVRAKLTAADTGLAWWWQQWQQAAAVDGDAHPTLQALAAHARGLAERYGVPDDFALAPR